MGSMDVKYAAARTSAALLVDHILATRDVATRQKILRRLAALVEKFFGSYFDPGTFAAARNYIEHPEGKWFQFVNRALNELNPKVVKTAVLDLGFDAAFYGLKQRADARKKYHCNIPWTILHRSHQRLQPALYRLLGCRIRSHPEPDPGPAGKRHQSGQSFGSPFLYVYRGRAPDAQSRLAQIVPSASRL
jgi:hypothetical protein